MTSARPTFGQVLRRLRIAANMSQEALAERARISTQAISALERGARQAPQRQTLALLVRALDLDAAGQAEIDAAARASAPSRVRRTPVQPAAPRGTLGQLPAIATSFVGRDDDRAGVDAALKAGSCLTIWGSGGAGKTRLALETARGVAPRFHDGVWFVELADVSETSEVGRAVAAATSIAEEADRPILDSLVRGLMGRAALLILDNAEHVIGECARIVERLLRDASSLTVLCTSREPLRVPGERVFPLAALPVPRLDDPALARAPAVRLFLDRAVSAGADIDETRELRSIATICGQLDAIPLALELAAARSPMMTPAQIVRDLGDDHPDRLRLLTYGFRNAPPRHRTLTGVLDWSVALLSEAERVVLRRLAVWPGRWTIDDAVAVACHSQFDRWAVVDAVSGLVQRSLVVATERTGEERHYRLLQTTRSYAAQRADEAGETERCSRLQAERMKDHLRQDHAVHMRGNRAAGSQIDLSAIRVALRWCLTLGNDPQLGAEIATAARWLWSERSAQIEGIAWLHESLARLPHDDSTTTFETLQAIAGIARDLMQSTLAYETASRALDVAERNGDANQRGAARRKLALAASMTRSETSGRELLEEALVLFDQAGNEPQRLHVMSELGAIAMMERRFAEARTYVLPLADGFRSFGNLIMAANSESNLAEVEFGLGNVDEAIKHGYAALHALRGLHTMINVAITTHNLAGYLLEAGDVGAAVRFARESLQIALEHGWTVHAAIAVGHLAGALSMVGDLHEAALLAGFLERDLRASGTDYRMETELRGHRRLMQRLERSFTADELRNVLRDGGEMDFDAATTLALDATAEPNTFVERPSDGARV